MCQARSTTTPQSKPKWERRWNAARSLDPTGGVGALVLLGSGLLGREAPGDLQMPRTCRIIGDIGFLWFLGPLRARPRSGHQPNTSSRLQVVVPSRLQVTSWVTTPPKVPARPLRLTLHFCGYPFDSFFNLL
jgi:hypothetical protein